MCFKSIWDVLPDWQDHIHNSNNIKLDLDLHSLKKEVLAGWHVTWWIKTYLDIILWNNTRNWEDQISKSKIKFQRAIPSMYCSILIAFEHTINLNFQEFDEVDASQKLVFVTTCTKYLKKYGNHSCQCIFSRS